MKQEGFVLNMRVSQVKECESRFLCILLNIYIKSRIAMAKAAFKKKKNLFTRKLDLNLRKRLVRCYVWSIALYGAETWMLRATDRKHLESFELWCLRRMEKISWADHVRNEEVSDRVEEEESILQTVNRWNVK